MTTIGAYLPWQLRQLVRLAEVQALNLRVARWKRSLSSPPELQRPIFMVGCPRSGTTLCARLLGQHPDVANWSVAGPTWDPTHYYDPEGDHHWGRERVTPQERHRLHATFEYYRQRAGKERFFNKHPRNAVRLEYIDHFFPDAIVIHVIRDGRAAAHSILSKIRRERKRHDVPFGQFCKPPAWREWLRADPVEQAALQWREVVSCARRDGALLGERYYEVTYEALCENPRATMARLYAHAGLDVDEEILAHVPERLESANDKYLKNMSVDQIETLHAVQGPLLDALGYSVTTT